MVFLNTSPLATSAVAGSKGKTMQAANQLMMQRQAEDEQNKQLMEQGASALYKQAAPKAESFAQSIFTDTAPAAGPQGVGTVLRGGAGSALEGSSGGFTDALVDSTRAGAGTVLQDAGTDLATDLATDAATDVAVDTATSSAPGVASGGGAGIADLAVNLGSRALGVDQETSKWLGSAAGLAAATALGGPLGASIFVGGKLLTEFL